MVPDPQVGALGRLAGAAHRHRVLVVVLWLVAVAGAVGLSQVASGDFKADYTARGSDSRTAQDLLASRFPAAAGEQVSVVVKADGPVTAPAVRSAVEGLLGQIRTVPHVVAAPSPYGQRGAISADDRILQATIQLDAPNPDAMPVQDTQRIIDLAQAADRSGLQVAVGGQVVETATQGSIGSEGIGLAAAAIILLLVFGSVVAAGLPILVAVVGLGVSASLVGVVAAIVDVPDWSTSLAAMMGIGVGVDYVLLLVTRYREYLGRGLTPRGATMATADTAGRAVLVAGSTVVVSLLGLFGMGLSAMRGAAVVTILAVLVVMLAAVTLLPALFGFVGYRIDRLRLPVPRSSRRPLGARWAVGVQRRPWVALGSGLVLLGLLAAPFLGVRYGFPDAGNDRAGTTTRQAYDLLAEGFGPGANGPLVLVSTDDGTALTALQQRIAATPGVAAVTPPVAAPSGDAAMMTVVPTTSPQSADTETLVATLRATVAGTGVHVGGVTAAAVDTNEDMASRLPLLIGGVVGLSFLLLLTVFRSLVVAVKAALLNLLSLAAAYGVVALVLQGGWAGRLIGIDTPTPLPAFVPVLMFAVLFGLSMDYEVFLLTRIRERWLKTGDNTTSVTEGLTRTARVVTAAAAIMIAVFAAFVPSPVIFLKVIGIGMAAAIFIDATVVRMLLVPAIMQLLGRANWWLPGWLERVLPRIQVEGADDHDAVGEPPARELQPA
ncbi:MAG TPA: MMPL family transporter [Mycobacteriales bacterium]|jgi:RND superfamily putative drug exporter|nr:MMPL family transporter [Mycobacteriales bacterium]